MKFSFLPAEVRYYDYFEQSSDNLLECARRLRNLLEHYENVEEMVGEITELEHRGDFIVHEVTNLLPRTLITPIDIEDIMRLISAIDDSVDAIDQVSHRLVIYQVTEIKKPAIRLSELILESAQELDQAVKVLRNKDQYPEVRRRIVQINTLENNADLVLREGLSDLVENRQDLFDLIRWKEIFELLEATTDRIEDAGDVIQRVIIANA
jgi:predicted phosphate transport protein (TIGR00153 family)